MTISSWIQQKRSLVFLFGMLVAVLPVLLLIAKPFFVPFILASIIAITINPIKEWLSMRTRRPGLATFLTTFTTVSLLGIFIAVAGFNLSREAKSVYSAFNQRSLEGGGWPAFFSAGADKFVDALASRIPVDKEAIHAKLVDGVRIVSSYLVRNIGTAIGGVTSLLVTGLLVTVFLYFLLKHGKEWIARIAALTPLDARTSESIIGTIRDSVIANVNGMLVVAIAQGALLIIGFWFVGVRSPALWGTLGGVASIIPVIGALIAWVPIALGLLVMGSYGKALALSLWCIILVGPSDNVLRPIVVGARNKQHPIIIALAAIGGTIAFGPLGIVLGPLTVSLAAVLFKQIQNLSSASHVGKDPVPDDNSLQA